MTPRQKPHPLPVDPNAPLTLSGMVKIAGELTEVQFRGWLLHQACQTQRNTYQLLKELKRMATNDDQLTQAVNDLLTAYTANVNAITAELANLKAATQPDTDPVITQAATNIENVVAQMNQATAAAQAAIAAPAPSSGTTDTPTSSSTGAGDDPGTAEAAASSASTSGAAS